MNKTEFFKILEEGLNDFPNQELQDILYDYKEHFTNALSEGKSEEEIILELGDPYVIVNQYRNGYIKPISYTKDHHEDTNNNSTDYEEPVSSQNNHNTNNKSTNSTNTFLKIAIAICIIILVAPVGFAGISGIFALIIGLISIPFAFSVSGAVMLFGKLGFNILGFGVPAFFADFPTSVVILVTIASIAATLLVILLAVYFVKFIVVAIRKLFNKLFAKGDF